MGSPDAATVLTNWSPGQDGDGYSWIVQLLPFMEENTLYDKITQSVGSGSPPSRYGQFSGRGVCKGCKRRDAESGNRGLGNESLYFCHEAAESGLPELPGRGRPNGVDLVSSRLEGADRRHGEAGDGQLYCDVVHALHRRRTTWKAVCQLPTGQRPRRIARPGTAYCGNGAMPFPGVVGGKVQKTGLGMQSLSDGSSHIPMISESREEIYTSWYSGLMSYGVAAWPNTNRQPAQGCPADR